MKLRCILLGILFVFISCSEEKSNINSLLPLAFLGTNQSYATFALRGSFRDSQSVPITQGTVRVVGGLDSSMDSNGNFEAIVSQPLVGNATDVELEFLQSNTSMGKWKVHVTVDTGMETLLVGDTEITSQGSVELLNLGSTGAAVSQEGEFVAYYHAIGTVRDKSGKALAGVQVDLPNRTSVRTNSSGTFKIPIIQTVRDGKNILKFYMHYGDVEVISMTWTVNVDTTTGETTIESMTYDSPGGTVNGTDTTINNGYSSVDGVETTDALIITTGSQPLSYSIGGSITGLTADGLILQNNGTDNLSIDSGSTTFTFPTQVSGAYSVTVLTQPSGQYCNISNGSSTATADVTSVSVICCGKLPPKTGQTTVYASGDDGTHQTGRVRSYTDNGDGTVTDNATCLIWQKCSRGQNNDASCSGTATQDTWANAGTYCSTLSLASETWRLPTRQELEMLPDYSTLNPAIDTTAFPSTVAGHYWSSTTYALDTTRVRIVKFDTGKVTINLKTETKNVRCVLGQVVAPSTFTDNGDGTLRIVIPA